MNEEVWKDVVEWEGKYKVSSLGRIFSVRKNKILSPSINQGGYRFFMAKSNGIVKNLLVHRQVALAFLEPPSKDLVDKCSKEHHGKVLVNHKDLDKLNNDYQNLEWCDGSHNMKHAYQGGVINLNLSPVVKKGVDSFFSLVKEQELVDKIREEYVHYSREFGAPALAKKYNLSVFTVKNIVSNRAYL